VERSRFKATRNKGKEIIAKLIDKKITEEKLIELYDSQGISPEMIVKEAEKEGLKIVIPENFYAKVAERHGKKEIKKKEELDLTGIPDTKLLFYEEKGYEFTAKVLKIVGNYAALDQTLFYPESGGQEFDTGFINEAKVIEVQKQGKIVMHRLEKINFKAGDEIRGKIDPERRKQLAIHHTATHIVNAAARKVLGNHIFQAGAKKSEEKAHLDVTHYKSITEEELEKIEKKADDIIKKHTKVSTKILPRDEAEKEYGFSLYQGGAVPEKKLRIIKIGDIDTEACGGTHVENTKDVKRIIILSTERIQDGISRMTFVAGPQAEKNEKKEEEIVKEVCRILGVQKKDAIKTTEKLFERWKELRKVKELKASKTAEQTVGGLESKFINRVLIEKLEGFGIKDLQEVSKLLSREDRLIILFGFADKISIFVSAGEKTNRDAGKIVKDICESLHGKGGGTRSLAQGICEKKDLEEIMKKLGTEFYG
jgi:alanyl-tRNA synthetase